MKNNNIENNDDIGSPDHSPYDPKPLAEADLWFLPAPPESAAPTDPPWPVADRAPEMSAEAWHQAEAAQYRAVLAAAQAVARFGERLRHFPTGTADRFALSSVSAVLRGEGVWIGPDQIALYSHLRLGTSEDAQDYLRAAWALRRLNAGLDPREDLQGFLGRTASAEDDLRPLIDHWTRAVQDAGDLHPICRAGFALGVWRRLDLSPFSQALEPVLAAQIIGAEGLARFLPLSGTARAECGGGAAARLAVWLAAVEAGALDGLLTLERLAAWQTRATKAAAGLSGRTPAALIGALLRLPVLSADLAARTTGCSAPGIRRNLALLSDLGLVREITGQSRYRFWTAQI
ncbi:MAG: hypothetical protein WBC93_16800 [Sulfitobacter sp.]